MESWSGWWPWLPIYVAAIAGASLMVLTRCLSMEDAYRSIEWQAVFLIAAMLPLGFAMQRTGAAELLAHGVVGAAGPYGPTAVLAGIVLLTLVLNQFIPSAVNAVVMTPIVMSPGGYRFADYMKNGLPLTVIVFVACVALLPVVFPF